MQPLSRMSDQIVTRGEDRNGCGKDGAEQWYGRLIVDVVRRFCSASHFQVPPMNYNSCVARTEDVDSRHHHLAGWNSVQQ